MIDKNELPAKRVSDSLTEQIQLVFSGHMNGQDRLFGGQLMEWIDIVAGVVARRHSNRMTTTASIDSLQFKEPVSSNSTLVLIGKMTYVGRTSMEVRIDSYVEKLDGKKKLVNTAYFVMVALDENNKPVPVPGLILETEEEKAEWEAAKRRYQLRKQRRLEQY